MQWPLIVILSLLYTSAISAPGSLSPLGNSPWREPGESYKDIAQKRRQLRLRNAALGKKPLSDTSPEDKAVAYDALDFSQVTKWQHAADLNTKFKHLRDVKFLTDGQNENAKRRLTWLYPDDGCYARADIMNHLLRKWGHPVPQKVFIFGNLKVASDHRPGGVVSWWYHVAPLVMVDEKPYVIDPSIEPRKPLTLKDWALKQVPELASATFAICGSFSYDPNGECDELNDTRTDFYDMNGFLANEWQRELALGHDPLLHLGDQPPWAE
jgi:hypothetical protein